MKHGKALGYLAGLLAVAVWSSVYSLKAVMLVRMGPVEIVFLQYLGTTALLALLAALRKQSLRVGWRAGLKLMCSGFVGVALFQVLLNQGIAMVGSVMASVFSSLLPAMCMLVDVAVLKKRWGWLGWVGIACSFAGILLVVGGAPLGGANVLGYLVLLASNGVWIFYCYFNKRFQGRHESVVLLFYQSLGAAVVLLPLAAASGFRGVSAMAEPVFFLQMLFLAAINGVVAYLLLNYTIRTLDVVVSNILFNFVPVFTIFLEWMVYGSGVGPAQLLGTALVISSALLTNLGGKRPL